MQKNRIKILLRLLLVFIPSITSSARIFTFGVSMDFGTPVHPTLFPDFYRRGFGCSGVLKYNLGSHTSLVLNLSSQRIQSDLTKIKKEIEDRLDPPYYVESLDNQGLVAGQVSLNILQYLQQKGKSYRFYLTAGGEYGFRRVHETKMTLFLGYFDEFKFDPEDSYQFGINGGLGFEIGLQENMCFYIQGVYHYLLTDEIELYNPRTGTIESVHDGTSFIITSIGFLVDL